MTIQHNTVQNMDVVQNTLERCMVNFNMTDLTLPESVYCVIKTIQEEISTTKLSGNTLIVSVDSNRSSGYDVRVKLKLHCVFMEAFRVTLQSRRTPVLTNINRP
jgi:cysteine sulfinate desulfinase/cysteine desulfurase-like protein